LTLGTNLGAAKRLAPAEALVYISKVMTTIVVIIHVLVCLALISIVLLQHGKGAGIGAAFGGSSQTVFGSTGAAPFLAKLTAVAAILFMLTSLSLTFLGRQQEVSVMKGLRTKPATQQQAPTPAAPAKPAKKPATPTPPATPAK
jgi:preprotein translocase subunit SecG